MLIVFVISSRYEWKKTDAVLDIQTFLHILKYSKRTTDEVQLDYFLFQPHVRLRRRRTVTTVLLPFCKKKINHVALTLKQTGRGISVGSGPLLKQRSRARSSRPAHSFEEK